MAQNTCVYSLVIILLAHDAHFLQGRMWPAFTASVSSGIIRVGWSPAAEALASWPLSALTAHPEDGLLLFLH